MLLTFALALAAPQDLVLQNARIWTGTDAAHRGDLVVRNGRIANSGEKPSDGARTIDL
jgi:dihydroorotase-like cyclic amidohydrolase